MSTWLRTLLSAGVLVALATQAPVAAQGHGEDNQSKLSVTVTFGGGLNTTAAANHHVLPKTIRIKAGGVVNFAVAGFHQIIVYNPGKGPEHVALPAFPPNVFVNDLVDVFYVGINPGIPPAPTGANPGTPPAPPVVYNGFNRLESVGFANPGRYLVICNVTPHFLDGMWAWVEVTGED